MAQSCEEFNWTQAHPVTAAPAISGVQLVYDTARQRVVFAAPSEGGGTETWEWDGANWLLHPGRTGPEVSNNGYSAVYDSVAGVSLLYTHSGETCSWDGNQWQRLSTAGPGPRYSPAMAFDSDRGVTVLFDGAWERDTWEWDGSVWTLVDDPDPDDQQVVAPRPRTAASMWYDPVRRRAVMCCGNGPFYERYYDTWAWDGESWEFIGWLPNTAGRFAAAATYDSSRGVGILFGGATGHLGDYWFEDTWEYGVDGVWRQVSVDGPAPTPFAGLAFDASRRACVLHGGIYIGTETWLWRGVTIHGGPTIVTQPADQLVEFGGVAVLSVEAGGEGTIRYQWRHNGAPLIDGGDISGSRSAVLTISNVNADHEGTYDVEVSNPCDSVVSHAAELTVSTCPADFNADHLWNSQDFFDFLGAFFAMSHTADIDGSGVVTSADLFAFLDLFFAGCDR